MPRFLGIASSAVQYTLPPLLVRGRQVTVPVSDRVRIDIGDPPHVPRLLASTLGSARVLFLGTQLGRKSCPDASVICTLHLSPTDIVIRLFCHGLDGRGGEDRA